MWSVQASSWKLVSEGVNNLTCGLVLHTKLTEVFINLTEVSLTLTVVFPCFFLSCKANARVKTSKDGAWPALFHILLLGLYIVIWVVQLLFVLFCVLFVCKCVLPPGDNPIAVNIYIISVISRSLSPRHGASSGCGWRNGLLYGG
jgi:hypothetical protein